MRITCSRCGTAKEFEYTASDVNEIVEKGWRSYGSALYCPSCSDSWNERNNKPLNSNKSTILLIDLIESTHRLGTRKYKNGQTD